jgi:hypothetical protein
MKKIPNHIDEQLLNYLDGTLPKNEATTLEEQLSVDEALRLRLETLRAIDTTLSHTKLETPSKNFTQLVMEGLHRAPVRTGLSARNGIFLILGVMTVVTILVLLVSTGAFDSVGVIQPSEIGMKNNYFNFNVPSISINGKILINAIIFLNLAIALIVLDRTILRPLFEKRTLNMRH